MERDRKALLFLGGLACTAALLGGTAGAQDLEKPERVLILSGSTGGSWYSYSAGLVPLFNEHDIAATTEPGGGAVNPLKLSQGEADAAFGQTSANYDAQQGQGAFEEYGKIENINNLALMSVDHIHLICTEESGITSWEQLPEARLAAPHAAASSWGNFVAGLQVHGIDPEDLNIVTRGGSDTNAKAVRDRQADCVTHTSAWPVAPFSELAVSIPIKVVGMSEEKVEEVSQLNPGLIPGEIPAGAYPGHDEDANVYLAGSVLMTHADLPEETAYWIVKVIGDNIEEVRQIHKGLSGLTVEQMAKAPVWSMHPGAERYYKEQGLM